MKKNVCKAVILALVFALLISSAALAAESVRLKANKRLYFREGPGNQYEEVGGYGSGEEYYTVVAKAYDSYNGIYWVKVECPWWGPYFTAWTGYSRFYANDRKFDSLPWDYSY